MNFDAGYGCYIKDEVNGGYSRRVQYQGLYDSALTFTWPTQYYTSNTGSGARNVMWKYDNTTLSFIGSFKLPTPSDVTVYFVRENAGNDPVRFYVQNIDGSWPEEYTNIALFYDGISPFTISEKYAGFTAYKYRFNTDGTTASSGWTDWRDVKQDGQYVTVRNGYGYYGYTVYQLEIRFTRNKYPINFLDGTYFDGDGNILEEATKKPLKTTEDIYYQADISAYAKDGDEYYTPTAPTGYTFGGWFIDETCTQEAEFDKMPEGGVTVYAKWVETQYRVFLHPNVPTTDTSLEWAQKDQKTSFRIDYNEKISGGKTIMGMRSDYELIGWYTDEACTKAFNFDVFTLNDTTVTEEYKQVEPTELG